MKTRILCILSIVAIIVGCSDSKFTLKGKIKQLHGAELLVYSPAMEFDRTDTIRIGDEEFTYSTETAYEMPLVIVFGNSSELTVFSTPGKTIKLEGDASSLKDIDVSGSESNELYTKFRKQTQGMGEQAIEAEAEKFIKANPSSAVSAYLLSRYFVERGKDKKALELGKTLKKSQPDNNLIQQIIENATDALRASEGKQAPDFTLTTYTGAKRTLASYRGRNLLLVFTAEWNTESRGINMKLRNLRNNQNGKLAIAQVAFDVNKEMWRNIVRPDSTAWDNAIEVEAFESTIAQSYAVRQLPCFVLIDGKGKIVLRGNSQNNLEQIVGQKLK